VGVESSSSSLRQSARTSVRCYSLASAAEAHSHVDTGHKRGSVVLSVREKNRSGIEKATLIPLGNHLSLPSPV